MNHMLVYDKTAENKNMAVVAPSIKQKKTTVSVSTSQENIPFMHHNRYKTG